MSERNTVYIGSRKSQLAMLQTEWVRDRLQELNPNIKVEIKTMDTTGDKVLDVSLSKIGDKGLFTKELEDMMLNGSVDLAVHSLKDIPTRLPDGLKLGAITKRYSTSDAFIANVKKHGKDCKLSDLPNGALIGSSSLRRVAQLKKSYPHLQFKDIRGNLNTRFNKLDAVDSEYDGMILAVAGLERMNLTDRISQVIPDEISLYAVGQGALGIECKENDPFIEKILEPLNHSESMMRCKAERSMLRELEGGCHVPIGVVTKINQNNILEIKGIVLNLDGSKYIESYIEGPVEQYEQLGKDIAADLIKKGSKEILSELPKKN
ncbi:porphobilinogen deaminase [Dictyostelium purpureum]|uniref:Porphobilinogen deaminase n=1 Tax=Dictyostelium purpureum TaxID=5786 RepID=F0ZS98_DICPU|nr:porphobilinogen deaminase [Dictyostelium purpureum]EGC33179.1 porphobilinogen deaminase [Dictyostelium purpureum]|eukprot:XP_003290299.1 porphobilinogen deaminase [Dictyostelium purpureum]